jgi:hypothetical protein
MCSLVDWCNGNALRCSYSGGARFEIGRVPIVLNEFTSGFPQYIETNAGTVPRLDHDSFHPNHPQFTNHPTPFDAVQSGY